jgi:CubicO group peptidase (beta-lactamase class C family)
MEGGIELIMISRILQVSIIFIVLSCFVFINTSFAREHTRDAILTTVSPGEVGLSSRRLARLDGVINGYIESGQLAGTVVLIARNGKIAHLKAYGQINIEAKKPMPPDAICRIASMTKVITSTALLILYEDGSFALTEPLSKYIPEFKNMKVMVPDKDRIKSKHGQGQEEGNWPETVPVEREIQIRDLLRHTAGFTYSYGETPVDRLYREAGFRNWNGTLADFVKKISQFPLVYQPGKQWMYSYSIDIAGYLVEKVSGQPLDEFMAQRIFEFLGMKDTGFYVPEAKLGRLTNHYKFEKGSLHLEESAVRSEFRKRPSALSGGGGWWTGYGGLVTTAEDFARFLQMILNYGKLGKKRLLSRKTVELMTANHIKGINKGEELNPGEGYGLGVGIVVNSGELGELSSPGGIYWAGAPYNTYFFLDFKERMFGIFLTQTAPFRHLNLMNRFQILTLQTIDD